MPYIQDFSGLANASAGGAGTSTGTGGVVKDRLGGVGSITGNANPGVLHVASAGSTSYLGYILTMPQIAGNQQATQHVEIDFIANGGGHDLLAYYKEGSGAAAWYQWITDGSAQVVFKLTGTAAETIGVNATITTAAQGGLSQVALTSGTRYRHRFAITPNGGGGVDISCKTWTLTAGGSPTATLVGDFLGTDASPLPVGVVGLCAQAPAFDVQRLEATDSSDVAGGAFTLTGPSAGNVNAASTAFTLTPTANYTGTITPSDGGNGGTFTPASRAWTGDMAAKTFTYTPSRGGAQSISASASPTLTPPASLTYTVTCYTTVTGTVAGDNYVLLLPVGLANTTAAPLVVFGHGYTGDETQVLGSPLLDFWRNTLTAAGYRVLSPAYALNSWGNDAAQNAVNATLTALTPTYNTNHVLLYGASMGGLNSTISAINNRISLLRGVALNCPVLSLPSVHADGTYAASIDTAYGGAGGYASAVATHDPLGLVQANAVATRNLRFRFYIATDDTAIPPASHVTPFIAALTAPEKGRIDVTGGHVSAATVSQANSDDLVAFYARCIAAVPALTGISVSVGGLSGGVRPITLTAVPVGADFGSVTVSVSAGTVNAGPPLTTTPPAATGASQTVTVTATSGSITGTGTYTVPAVGTVATPTFSPIAGTFTAAQTVTLACATAGAAIHYTVDGTMPTAASPAYTVPLTVSTTQTIKALAVKAGSSDSAVASALFTINLAFAPPAGVTATAGVERIALAWTPNSDAVYTEVRATSGGALLAVLFGNNGTVWSLTSGVAYSLKLKHISAAGAASGETTAPAATPTAPGSSGGVTTLLVKGPLALTPDSLGSDGTELLFVGDNPLLRLHLIDGAGNIVPVGGGTLTATTIDNATGAVASNGVGLTVVSDEEGLVTYAVQPADTTTPRRLRLTVRRTANGQTQTFGPLILRVLAR